MNCSHMIMNRDNLLVKTCLLRSCGTPSFSFPTRHISISVDVSINKTIQMELSVVVLLKKTTEPFRSWILDHDHVTDHDPGFFIPELVEFELKDVWFPDDCNTNWQRLFESRFPWTSLRLDLSCQRVSARHSNTYYTIGCCSLRWIPCWRKMKEIALGPDEG